MTVIKTQDLGVFAAGEVPFPLLHTYKDANGVEIDITGWTPTVQFEVTEGSITGVGTGAVAIEDGPNGQVSYTWVHADMAEACKVSLIIWVEDGTNQLASDKFKYAVYDGPGDTPPAP